MKTESPSGSLPTGAPERRPTRVVRVGDLPIGGTHPILIQSMTIANTLDTEAVVSEIRELVDAGCPLVRVTAPTVREAENLREIRRHLHEGGIRVPMVADIHFTPNAALVAAEIVEKVRINPGNYADRKRFAVREYTDQEYGLELERVRDRFRPLVQKCMQNGVAMRIGTNHGSLSDRIMNRYGDTPLGMVESALEFVRICEDDGYREIVLSMKSSVPSVMIAAYRLLVQRMDELGMDYPLHLGVTEAGDGLLGRIKSAIGIGSLLADGIGDTIRVSLTEDSRHEISAAQAILDAIEAARPVTDWPPANTVSAEPSVVATAQLGDTAAVHLVPAAAPIWKSLPVTTAPPRRRTLPWKLRSLSIGGEHPVRVEARTTLDAQTGVLRFPSLRRLGDEEGPEFFSLSVTPRDELRAETLVAAITRLRDEESGNPSGPSWLGPNAPLLLEWTIERAEDFERLEPVLPSVDGLSLSVNGSFAGSREFDAGFRALARVMAREQKPLRFRLGLGIEASTVRPVGDASGPTALEALVLRLRNLSREEGLNSLGFVCEPGTGWLQRVRQLARALDEAPDLLFLEVPGVGPTAALLAGAALNDGLGDALCLVVDDAERWPAGGRSWHEDPVESAYAILQASRLRLTRTEFIACPSCGRTQFDLQSTTAKIQARTSHLKGIKIAIMGCIVNGPGEMADADFGYVGSGAGKVDLYVGKQKIRHGIPAAEAEDRLVELIREHGRWNEPGA